MQSRPPRPNVFAGPYLDRRTEMRERADWLEEAARSTEARFVPVWQAKNLFRREANAVADHPGGPVGAAISHANASALIVDGRDTLLVGAAVQDAVFLGAYGGHATFLVELDDATEPPHHPHGEFRELRFFGSILPPDEAGLLAYARALAIWRQRNRFCSACGSPMRSTRAGHVLVCTNTECRHEVFPRLDPAIIVLITDGKRALLGRQATWPKDRYSTIAGFVEPGESLEDAVVREVLEETGVRVDRVTYHSSQPWPFPSSLMVGFTAWATGTDIVRADQELEDARWFSREEISQGTPLLPPTQSISFRLIEDWYDSGSDVPLARTPGVRLGVPTPTPPR